MESFNHQSKQAQTCLASLASLGPPGPAIPGCRSAQGQKSFVIRADRGFGGREGGGRVQLAPRPWHQPSVVSYGQAREKAGPEVEFANETADPVGKSICNQQHIN